MDEIEETINKARLAIAMQAPSRERALAITKLDEAALWYGVAKSIEALE